METNNKCIVLTGGGTAGHVMPNINLSSELSKHFTDIVYIGSNNGIENKLIKENTKYKFEPITTVKLNRGNPFKNFSIPFKLTRGKSEAKKLLKKYKPSIVFSKGGYVGLPVVMAAKELRIPIVCHESDISMGLANKLAKRYATKICTNFESTAKQYGKKCIHTGTPLKLSKLSKAEAKQKLGISTNKPVLLVAGGSLGAKAINNFIFENIESLTKEYYIIHIVGKGNKKEISNINYKQIEFTNDMWTIYKATDFALSRAGANTIVELLANKILTIFIPLPKAVSRGDQIQNAIYLQTQNLARFIEQENMTINNILKELNYLKLNKSQIENSISRAKFEDGTKKIMEVILKEKAWQNHAFFMFL